MKSASWKICPVLALGLIGFELIGARGMANSQPAAVIQGMRGDDTRFYARVALNGERNPHWWVIDTGSLASYVSSSEAKNLRAAQISGARYLINVLVPAFEANQVDLGGHHFGPFTFLGPSAEFASFKHRVQYTRSFDIGGIIGIDFLLEHRALIDFGTGRILLSDKGNNSPERSGDYERMGFTVIPIRITPRQQIEVLGSVAAKTYSFMVDTGAAITFVSAAIRRATGTPAWTGVTAFFPLMSYANRNAAFGPLPGFKLGSQDISGDFVVFTEVPVTRSGFSHPFGGLLGQNVLWSHQAILDIGSRTLYLKPDARARH